MSTVPTDLATALDRLPDAQATVERTLGDCPDGGPAPAAYAAVAGALAAHYDHLRRCYALLLAWAAEREREFEALRAAAVDEGIWSDLQVAAFERRREAEPAAR